MRAPYGTHDLRKATPRNFTHKLHTHSKAPRMRHAGFEHAGTLNAHTRHPCAGAR